jgi:hypothetical protein
MGRASAKLMSTCLGLYDHGKEDSRIAGKEIAAEQRELQEKEKQLEKGGNGGKGGKGGRGEKKDRRWKPLRRPTASLSKLCKEWDL